MCAKEVYPGQDVTPLSRGSQTGQRSPSDLTLFMSLKPGSLPPKFTEEVAVTAKADPSVTTGGVGTLDLVLTTGTFLAKVAVEVALKAWPVWH